VNDAERIDALIQGRTPDRVPVFVMGGMGFALTRRGMPISTLYNDFSTALNCYRKTAMDFQWLYAPYLAYAAMGGWEFGGDIKWPDGEFSQAPSVTRHPVATSDEAFKLNLPQIDTAGMVPKQIDCYRQVLSEPDHLKAWRMICQIEGVFTFASNIAGAPQFSRWLIKRPDAAHHLLTLTVDFLDRLARHIKALFGTERVLIFSGEPAASNQLISPKMFAEYVRPYTLELHGRLLDMGFNQIFKHICGDQNMNLPHWQGTPLGNPGFASFGHEVALESAAEYFPNDIIVGNLDPSIIQAGSEEEVYAAAKTVIEKGKSLDQGFVFAPGCALPPKSPPDNIRAMARAVDDFGWY
jgi:uroporphyrinogen decarboxylase